MMDPAQSQTILRQVAEFKGATTEDIHKIASLCIPRAVEENSFFFLQGEVADHLYILVSGRVKLSSLTPEGQQVNLRTIQPVQLFGAIGAVSPGASYPASAQAMEDCSAIAIRSGDFRPLLEQRPYLSFGLMRLMTGYIQEMQERYREMATEKVEQRIARVLVRLAGQTGRKVDDGVLIELSFSRQDLAEMAGTTIYSVSRVLSAWEKTGILATGRERVTLTKPHAIMRLSEGK